MAEEYDRKIMPEFLQTTFSVSLGACYSSFEMIKDPLTSANKMFEEVKALFMLPKDAPADLKGKAEAIAGVWMDKGMTLVEHCKNAGEKFTEGK
jgi:hypothetical protein